MNEIVEKLKEQGIKMRPKWQFIVESALLVALTVLAFLFTLFVASFLLFYLRRFGFFFGPFPLILLLLAVLFVILAEKLVNHYALAYRKPVVYSLIIIILSVLVLGFLVDMADFHERMERRNFPVIRRIYRIPPPERFMPSRNINFEIKVLPRVY